MRDTLVVVEEIQRQETVIPPARGNQGQYLFFSDLQRFADEDSPTGQKTESATPRRRQQARDDGHVAKSQDVSGVMVLFAGFLSLYYASGHMMDNIRLYTSRTLQRLHQVDWSIGEVHRTGLDMILQWLLICWPVVLACLLAGLIANFIQVGFLFTLKPLKFNPERLNPLSGFKRIFSLSSLNELGKSLLKLAAIIYLPWRFLTQDLSIFPYFVHNPPLLSLETIAWMTFKLCLQILLILFVISLIDYGYQKYQYEKSLKMSKYDVKQEFKQMEGDPKIKAAIRRKMMQMSRRSLAKEVPKADVVITNPTHYAIALRYNRDEGDHAPVCLAKGTNAVALRIRELARENGVYIYEAPPLARALYPQVDVGEAIPEELFVAVAEVLAHVYKYSGRRA